jgi:aminoglycoside phosphotransferase (APT) family kinase protein
MQARPTAAIPVSELQRSLEQVLSVHFRRPQRIRSLRRRISSYSSSFVIENLELELEAGQHLRLVLKDLSPKSMLPTARAVRPAFLYLPHREIQVYTRILQELELGTPVCYGAIESPEQKRYWLFLERVEGPLLWQVGRMEVWENAARWLAILHSKYQSGEFGATPLELDGVLAYDEPLLRRWLSRAEGFLRSKNGKICRTHWRRFDQIASRYDLVIERLMEMPKSLIHGEYFPSNIMVRRQPNPFTICPIDWEVAGIGPGLVDLAALTLGNWTPAQRARLISAYHQASREDTGRELPIRELIEAVSYCQLHLSIQLLGWSSDWCPPEKHARNWLGEASRLAEAVGI